MRRPCEAVRVAITRLDAEMGPLPDYQLAALLPYPRGLIRATLAAMPDRPAPVALVVTPTEQRCRCCGKSKPLAAYVEREDGSRTRTCEPCQVARRVYRERATPQARAWQAFTTVPAINPAPLRWAA